MRRPEVVTELRSELRSERLRDVLALVERARRPDGSRALSDHLWIDLQHGGDPGFVAVLDRDDDGLHDDGLVAYAQASTANGVRTAEVVVDPSCPDRADCTARVLGALLDAVRAEGGGTVTWWVADPEPAHDALARRLGLTPTRSLLQMRRPLPVAEPITIATRPFVPGVDDEAWLRVNNRAFADHGEQGGWDLDTLRSRFREPWFDPDGFVLHEIDGRLAGSCWTKLHLDLPEPLGEIYVVSVDPDHHGKGLGAQLTLAGLDWLHRHGVSTGMLHVDGDNAAAVHLYQRLGFAVHRIDRAYTGELDPPDRSAAPEPTEPT